MEASINVKMEMTIYFDDIFIYNLLFDYIIIDLSCWYMKKELPDWKCKLALSITDALISTIFSMYYIRAVISEVQIINSVIQYIFPIVICMVSAAVIYRINSTENKISLGKIFEFAFVMYFLTILFGGLLNYLYLNNAIISSVRIFIKRNSLGHPEYHYLGIILLVLITLLLKRILKMFLGDLMSKRSSEQVVVAVIICNNGVEVETKALLDTGNSLTEPVSKKPVSVVESDILRKMGHQKLGKVFCVPYVSVGSKDTVLYAFEVDYLKIQKCGEVYMEKNALIGVYNGKLSSKNEFSMILNNVYCSKI